jgi:glycolate dehydrogenase iron-sulfur subunit
VVIPRHQGCCGALSVHSGREPEAKAFARKAIETFEHVGADYVVVNAAGCGSSMKEYGELFADEPDMAGRAGALASKVRDVAEVLVELGPVAERHPLPMRVAYHDSCHLAHAQGVRAQPRSLLAGIPGVDIAEIAEPEICCGSAGIYNLLEPEAATDLRDRKVQNILRTEADLIVSGNPGCLLQIATGLEAAGRPIRIMHLVELIDRSITEGRNHSGSTDS